MRFRHRFASLVVIALGTTASSVRGQPLPDPDLWGPATVVNPSGLRPVPVLAYDPATGIMSLDNLGVDRVSNTPGGSSIGGDDVGVIAVRVSGPTVLECLPPFMGGTFDPTNMIGWSCPGFSPHPWLIGTSTPNGQYIRPGRHDLFLYPPGLGAAHFFSVEIAVNFAVALPGAVLSGRVQVVPEPSVLSCTLLATCLIMRRVFSIGR
jgi:hypothetical protein